MPLPRFSSGRVGRLSYDVVNQAFDKIERPEDTGSRTPFEEHPTDVFYAFITGVHPTVPTRFSFIEIQHDGPADLPTSSVSGGRTSSDGTDQFAYPAIGTGATEGDRVLVVSMFTKDGLNIFRIIPRGNAGSFPARIVSSTTITTNVKWQYQVKRVTVSGTAFSDAQSNTSPALNGAESVADAPPVFGVGMQPPTSGTLQMIRQPIRNNVIVTVCDDGGGNLVFSMPNGYRVIC